jgi:NADH-dependent peroxiredoxin subunit F
MDFPGLDLDLGAVRQGPKPDPNQDYDLIIVGGGPAAMSAVVYAARKMIALALITKDYGGQLRETSEVDNYLGFQNINARDLNARFEEHVSQFNVPVAMGVAVTRIEHRNEGFQLHADDGNHYRAKTLLLATGTKHRRLDVPGEAELSGRGVTYCATCDAPFYKDKQVVVVGGGNSAFTSVLDLSKVNATITLVGRSKQWAAEQKLQERVRQYERLEMLSQHEVVRIEGQDRVEAVVVRRKGAKKERTIPAQGIFIDIGLSPNSELAAGLAGRNQLGEIEVDYNCRTSVAGLFAAGDVTTVPYKQIIVAAGEGTKAALAAYDFLVENRLI